ncbi:MAG: ATPase, T2SS/T4P/T4SS family [Nanoarchaeota archaeon]|nr:ATPase, T2SS/T4P/T4SS family [Nanoarchaeota archaeon]
MREVVDKYKIEEGFDIDVKITGGPGLTKRYELVSHEIHPATQALLDQIKEELIGTVRISAEEILDPKVVNKIKNRFRNTAKELIEQKLPGVDKTTESFLIMTLLKEMLGLGDIEVVLSDPYLEEIVILSAHEPLRVFHKKHGWLETNIKLRDEMQVKDYFNTIARRVGRQITTLNPLLDAHLLSGDRANAVLYPVSSKGNTLTIRRFSRDPWTVTDLIKNKTAEVHIFALIWLAIQYESNILISGGTGSGKTSFLNVCMPFMPPNHRIISIEDTRELMLPDFLYWCPLTTREPNPEGKGAVTMLDLLINALRMRPDRIVLGEMRKKDQAEVLFEAMHTGHSVYATVHADSVAATIQRLTNPPLDVPGNLLSAVHLNIVMFRNRQLNIRRLYQVGEFIASEEAGRSVARPNVIYRWNPSTDKIVAHNKPLKLFEELSRHTGFTMGEINDDLKQKEAVLNWMVKHNVRDVQSVGKVMHQYYLDTKSFLSEIHKNVDPKKLLGDMEK